MLFVSKIRDLRLIKRPADRTMDKYGNASFTPGELVEFSNFRYVTGNEETIEWLLKHPDYGRVFTSDKLHDKGVPQEVRNLIQTDDTLIDMSKDRGRSPYENAMRHNSMVNKASKKLEKMKTPMTRGMLATAQPVQSATPREVNVGTKAPEISKDEIAAMIKEEVGAAMGQILEAIKAEKAPKPKRVFTCKECGETFPTGIAVGAHKKEAHATPEVTE